MANDKIETPKENTDTLPTTPEEITPDSEFTDKSNAELQEELIKLGMPSDDAKQLKTSKVIISVINTLRANAASGKVDQPISAAVDPKEDKKVVEQWTSKAHRQWGYWDEQPKVKIIVPLNGKEKQGVIRWVTDPRMKRLVPVHVSGAVQSVIENGARYLIPKGVYSEVPEPVARIIEQKFQQTSEAGAEIRADRIDPETGRPVLDQL